MARRALSPTGLSGSLAQAAATAASSGGASAQAVAQAISQGSGAQVQSGSCLHLSASIPYNQRSPQMPAAAPGRPPLAELNHPHVLLSTGRPECPQEWQCPSGGQCCQPGRPE